MKFARIANGLVAEVVIAADADDLGTRYHPSIAATFVACGDSVAAGYIYDGASFAAPPPPAGFTVDDLARYAAQARWQQEVAGTTLDLGGGTVLPVPTDREGRAALKQARDMLRDGELLDADGNVKLTMDVVIGALALTLDAAQVTAVLKRSAQHVQAAYTTQKTVIAGITAGTITTTAAIDAAFGG